MKPKGNGGRISRPSFFSDRLAELLIVGAASLFAIFIVIPAQTSPSDEIGLSPGLVPTVCATAIGLLAVIQFARSYLVSGSDGGETRAPIRHALLLMGAALSGVTATWAFGLLVGCSLLALLVSLILGERRPTQLVLVVGGTALVIFLVEWLGF